MIDATDESSRHVLEKILRDQYDVVIQTMTFGAVDLEIMSLSDPDVLLDERTLITPHGQLPWQPYWGKVWTAALGLAHELARMDLRDQSVIDLGCGLGIPGAVAAAQGAHVVLADNALPALPFAEFNSWPWRDRVEVTSLDWHADRLGRRFDFIVGSDIIYDRSDLPALSSFWQEHLAPGGQVWLADPGRLLTLDLMPQVYASGWAGEHRSIQLAESSVNLFQLTPVGQKAVARI